MRLQVTSYLVTRIRSCTEVRILPLHPHVAMRFIPLFLMECSGCLYLSARASLFAPLGVTLAGVTCYLSPVMKAIAHSHDWQCSDFPPLPLWTKVERLSGTTLYNIHQLTCLDK